MGVNGVSGINPFDRDMQDCGGTAARNDNQRIDEFKFADQTPLPSGCGAGFNVSW